MSEAIYFDNYTAVGDIIVFAVCVVMVILIATSFATKTQSFYLFMTMVTYLAIAAITNLILHDYYAHMTDASYVAIRVLKVIYHAFLFSLFLLYVVYFVHILGIKGRGKKHIMMLASAIYLVVVITDIVNAVTASINDMQLEFTEITGLNVFMTGYIAFCFVIIFLIVSYRNRIYINAIIGIVLTSSVSFLVLFNQGRYGQSSFTTATFLFPILAIMYLLHSNPFDIKIGAVNSMSFLEAVSFSHSRKRGFCFVSMYLPDFHSEGKHIPPELQKELRQFPSKHFNKSVLFRITNGHMLLMMPEKNNPEFDEKMGVVLKAFYKEFEIYHFDYKLIIGHSIDEISEKNEYLSFIKSIQRKMNINTVHYVNEEDVAAYNRTEDIIKQLEDIYRKDDLNDERVLAYCQPVLNIKTGKYDTAEALMRLKLPGLGMVFPDQFIPLAEEYDFIHVLTRIILNKTCETVKSLLAEGYEVKRISVNVSVPELRDESFTGDIESMISSSGIPNGKIAIEITESRSETDQMIIRNMIDELKGTGMKFYLDDFGTGYSNMERIMKLPFDIIKFDRSLLLAAKSDERSEKIVGRLAQIFADLGYSVLYEGVEDDDDEARCKNMCASYLQGYKYSKPVPIEELRNFFTKAV